MWWNVGFPFFKFPLVRDGFSHLFWIDCSDVESIGPARVQDAIPTLLSCTLSLKHNISMSMWAQFATKDPDGLVRYSMGLSINQTLLLQNSHWHVFTADKSISFLFISFSIYGTTEQRQTLRTPLVIKPHGFFRQEIPSNIFVRPSSGLCVTDAFKLRVPRRDACWRAVKRSLRDLTRKTADWSAQSWFLNAVIHPAFGAHFSGEK